MIQDQGLGCKHGGANGVGRRANNRAVWMHRGERGVVGNIYIQRLERL